MVCVTCKDIIKDFECVLCGKVSRMCKECHNEVVHGVLSLHNVPQCGNLVPYPSEDAVHFPGKPSHKFEYRDAWDRR